MNIRKFAVLGGFAIGAAVAFAPLASAVPDPTLVTDTLDSEIASLNGTFQLDALLAGVPSSDYGLSGGFDEIFKGDVTTVQGTGTTPFDYAIYGVDPAKAGLAGDPGSYNDLNGALAQFDNAYNVELYSLANGGTIDNNLGDYIYNSAISHVLTTPALDNTASAFDYLYNFGIGDLSGFFQTDLSFLDITPAI